MMAHSTPPTAAVQKLPIWATVVETYNFVFSNLTPLLRASVAPFIFAIVLGYFLLVTPESNFFRGIIGLLGALPYAIFCVAWCRVTLLGPTAGYPPLLPSLNRRVWLTFGYIILLGLVLLIAATIVGAGLGIAASELIGKDGGTDKNTSIAGAFIHLFYIFSVFFVLIFYYFAMRLGFIFPTVAVDEKYSIKQSWSHTQGQGLRLLGAFLLAVAPAFIVTIGIGFLGIAGFGAETGDVTNQSTGAADSYMPVVFQFASAIGGYISMALMFTLISFSFRRLTGWVPHTAPPTATSGDASFGDNA